MRYRDATERSTPFAKVVRASSPVDPDIRMTKAGVTLNADARAKLQALADWLEGELKGTNDPESLVKFGMHGAVVTYCRNGQYITYVSSLGALVQMYDPFTLVSAVGHLHTGKSAPLDLVLSRAAKILNISLKDLCQVRMYYLAPLGDLPVIIQKLRDLA